MYRAESATVPNVKLPLSSPVELAHVTFLAMMCDNTHGVLPTREAPLEFLSGIYYIGMTN